MKQTAKRLGPGEGALTVYDAENGIWLEITKEDQQEAAFLHNQILMGSIISAMGIKRIFDKRLYYGLGFQSRDEYIATLPFGRRTCYRMLAIAQKVEAVTNLLGGGEIKPLALNDGSIIVQTSALNDPMNSLAELGTSKLYELTNLEDDEVAELIKRGKVKLEGGELELQDILDSTVRETAKTITALKKKYSSKVNEQSEEIRLLEEERKVLSKKIKKYEEELGDVKMDLSIFGPTASKLKDKQEFLSLANQTLNNFNEIAVRAGVSPEDPEAIRCDLSNLIRKIDEVHKLLVAHYGEVLELEGN